MSITTVRKFAKEHFPALHKTSRYPKQIYKEIDKFCPTKINHAAVFRLIQRSGFIGVWTKAVDQEPGISYELELAYRLLRVFDNEVAARSLIVGWWRKHGMVQNASKLNQVVSVAMAATTDERSWYQKKIRAKRGLQGDRRTTDTAARILDALRDGQKTRLVLIAKLQLSAAKVQMGLGRLVRAGKVVKVAHGLYALAPNSQE
jgi:hypothetical protein